ncbi:hypothetical protein E1H13_06680 [Nodosilinea sp. P-1105]|nr:hypothetical protein [Nodosilinea sp. P-1105]
MPFAFYLLPTTFCLLPFAFCLLPFAFCLLPFAFCLLPSTFYLLPSTFYLLPQLPYDLARHQMTVMARAKRLRSNATVKAPLQTGLSKRGTSCGCYFLLQA